MVLSHTNQAPITYTYRPSLCRTGEWNLNLATPWTLEAEYGRQKLER